jgi:hypothetical protein
MSRAAKGGRSATADLPVFVLGFAEIGQEVDVEWDAGGG